MLLDHLADAHGFRTGDLASASVVVEYRELFDDIIGERGWAGLCRLNSAQKFDRKLKQSILKSQSIAKAVEALCRSAEDGAEEPSVAFAEYAIRWWSEEMEVTLQQSPQHIAKNNEALLIHLLLEHFPDLVPSALKNSRFTRQLVAQGARYKIAAPVLFRVQSGVSTVVACHTRIWSTVDDRWERSIGRHRLEADGHSDEAADRGLSEGATRPTPARVEQGQRPRGES
jgi:hypothetical protein